MRFSKVDGDVIGSWLSLLGSQVSPSVRPHNLPTGFWPSSATMLST